VAGRTYRCEHCLRGDRASGLCGHCGYDGIPRNDRTFLPEGTELANRYLIGRSEGSGGYSICYRAWDRRKSEIVAIKELFPGERVVERAASGEVVVVASQRRAFLTAIAGLRREADCLAKLRNEAGIVQVGEFFETNGTAYLTMEFLRGRSYLEYLQSKFTSTHKFQPVPESVDVALGVLGSLAAIHKLNLRHLDIKPSNLRVFGGGRIKLIDFGSAREAFRRDGDAGGSSYTPEYAAPEQFDPNAAVSAATDFYALGALIYYSLTLRAPTPAKDRLEGQQVLPLQALNPSVPEALDKVVRRAMALEPAERFQSTKEFWAALEPFRSSDRKPPTKEPKSRPAAAGSPSRARRMLSGVIDAGVLLFLPGLLRNPLLPTAVLFALAALVEFLLLQQSGSTIGMMLAGTRAVRADGAVLSGGTALLRMLMSPVAFVRALSDGSSNGRMVHDIHTDTEVVRRHGQATSGS